MERRIFIIAGLVCLLSGSARAEDGADDKSDGSGSNDSTGDGADAGGDGESGDGASGDGGSPGDGDGGGGGEAPGGADDGHGGDTTEPGNSRADGATGGAIDRSGVISLRAMLAIFRSYGQATIVDVRLLERKQILVYAFKFIDAEGRVRRAYFDAHSGKAIG